MPSRLITLRGVDAKIVRAEKHLETLETEILTCLNKKPALTDTTSSSFPVCGTPKEWDDRKVEALCRVPKGARAIIESLQPCSGTEDGALLGFLNSLSNRDKHKLINLTVTRAVNTRFALTSRGSQQTVHFAPLPAPFDPDASIEVTDLTEEFMEGGVDVKMQGCLTVAFKDGRLAGRNARDLLSDIVVALKDRVLPQLRPFIRP